MKQEIEQLKEAIAALLVDLEKVSEKQNKAAAARARKATLAIGRLFLQFRKNSVAAMKLVSKRKQA